MFGKRSTTDSRPAPSAPVVAAPKPAAAAPVPQGGERLAPLSSAGLGAPLVSAPATPARLTVQAPAIATDARHSEGYYETKGTVFGALIEAIDLAQLARLDAEAGRGQWRKPVAALRHRRRGHRLRRCCCRYGWRWSRISGATLAEHVP